MPQHESRLATLDGLRGLAALIVVISHIGAALRPTPPGTTLAWDQLGHVGVVIFFLCSGFIIPVSLEHTTLPRFWIRRFFRLYPLYWVSLLAIAACFFTGRGNVAFVSDYHFDNGSRLLTTLLINLTMLQHFSGVEHLLQIYWTLGLEMVFYVIVSIAAPLGYLRRIVPITLGTLLSLLLVILLTGVSPFSNILFWDMSFVVIMFIGTIIERARRGKISWKATNMIALLTFSLLVGVADTPSHFMSMLARCVGFAIFSGALLLSDRRIPSSLRRLGVISYSIYLMHPFAITLIPQIGSAMVTGLIWLGSSIAIAALTYGLIELPAMTFGRQLTSRVTYGRQLRTVIPRPAMDD